MPSANAFQTNFSAGELSPRLYARVDVGKYMNGCQVVENMIVQRFGGARKRGGTEYINTTASGNAVTRLVPFIFSVTQAYILEFTAAKIRIYTNGGIVESGGSPVEVVSPYGAAELFELQFAQSADVLYITHPNHAPRRFARTSATTFTITEVVFEDGPFLEVNTSNTTLTPASTGHATPKMTGLTAPSGTVTSKHSGLDVWEMFDREKSGDVNIDGGSAGWVKYDFGAGNSKIIDAYWLTSSTNETKWGDAPNQWEIRASNDDTTWIALDSRDGQSGWTATETRFFTFENKTAYRYYQFNFSGGGGDDAANVAMAELAYHQAADDQTPFNLTASSTTGVNGGQGFLSSDVGRHIRMLGSDGRWRWARITSRVSSTVVKIVLYGQALPDTSSIINWRMGAWSDETGWPGTVGFYSGRLCFARTAEQPQTVWMSRVDDFTDFSISSPLQDDDAITATISSDSLNEIKWIAEGTDLFVGTTAAIRTIGPTTSTAAFSPTNIRQKRETNYGASDVQPVRVGTTALYSGYYRKDIREISYSFDFNGYVSQNLSILSEHITGTGIVQMAYAQDPDSVVWSVDDPGILFGMTYERDQEVIAFHTHPLGGTADVESVATIPGTGFDEVWMVASRTINGSPVRYIERLTEGLSDTGSLDDATFLDCHLTYSGASTTTLSGLSHLEGEEVYVWSNVGKQGPYTVSSGSITVGSAVTKAVVGYAYTSALETLSPEAAARAGTAQTRLGRVSEVFMRLNRSMGGMCGPADGTLETLEYDQSEDINGAYGDPDAMFTGDVRVPIDMSWERGKRIRVEHSEPTPFHVLGLITEIRVSG